MPYLYLAEGAPFDAWMLVAISFALVFVLFSLLVILAQRYKRGSSQSPAPKEHPDEVGRHQS